MKKLKAGLIGFGVVGTGVFQALKKYEDYGVEITRIAVKNIDKNRNIEFSKELLTQNVNEIVEDSEIDLIIELINDPEEAFEIVTQAFQNGKSVVSANKKMVALYLEELFKLTKKNNVKFFYEAAVCGSIPIIRTIDQHFQSDKIKSIETIANGTCNFILSKMVDDGQSYDNALNKAQELGFAESDPYSDVSGEDTRFKLSIMIYHAFGQYIHPENIPMQGITSLDNNIIEYAKKHQLKIKLIGEALLANNKIEAKIEPKLISKKHDFYNIENEYNGVIINSEFSGEQFLKGKGAGSYPTTLAVLSNLKDIRYNLASTRFKNNERFGKSNSLTDKVYFVSGSKEIENSEGFDILEEFSNHKIIKTNFQILNKLKLKDEKFYWAEINEELYDDFTKVESLL